jgi:hypothetical protein
MAYPKSVYFPASDNRVIINVMPGGRFSAIDPDQPQEGCALIWGLGNTELEAIADLARQISEAE